jgi:hypothetical protein
MRNRTCKLSRISLPRESSFTRPISEADFALRYASLLKHFFFFFVLNAELDLRVNEP